MKENKIAYVAMLAGIVLCLLYIWLPTYFITGDGPCHVYNAQVLHDLWCNRNTTYYHQYYKVVYQPNPNWLSTVLISLLLFVVNGIVAEKVWLTAYLFLYLAGFYLLLRKISNRNPYFLLVILLLAFPQTLSKGFYNFSFSVAFYFWVVWCWVRFLEKRNARRALLFILFATLIFFAHLLAFGFAAFSCAALTLSFALCDQNSAGKGKNKSLFFTNAALLAVMLAPFIFLMNWFTNKEGGMQLRLGFHPYRLIELAQFKYLVNVTHAEDSLALIAGITLLALICACLLRFKGRWKVNKYDGFLVSLLFFMAVYLTFPDTIFGTVVMASIRVQLFVMIGIVCCVAYMAPSEKIKNIAAAILFACFAWLSIVRIACLLRASPAISDYLSAAKCIKPYSVILPLDFSPCGTDEKGRAIADGNFLFFHAAQYMGIEKPLIILDNYEANTKYFPLSWTDRTNPYKHLGQDEEGIEGTPPSANIEKYRQATGVTIDYIVMWCYKPSFLQNEHFRKLYDEINSGYHVVYTSPTGRTVLYQKNGLLPL